MCDLVEERSEAEHGLRIGWRAIVGADDRVGVHRLDDFSEVRNLVEVGAAQVTALLAVGPDIGHRVQLYRRDGAVLFYADFVFLLRRPAAMHADVIVLPGELELHRLAGDFGEHGGHVIVVLRLILVAEAAAHVFTDHAYLAERQAKILGDVCARVGDALRRGKNRQLTRVPFGHAYAPLELRVVRVLGDVGIFKHPVGFVETLLQVSPRLLDGRAEVALADGKIAVGGNLWRIRFEGLVGVQHMGDFSYLTAMSPSASSAMCRSVAATAATASPTKRTGLLKMNRGCVCPPLDQGILALP